MGGIKKYWTLVAIALLSTFSYGQITSGKITFERRTNLKKKFGEDERMKHFLTEENKIKTEVFELYFDENRSLFKVVENDDDEKGFMSYTTQRNVTYQNLQKDELRCLRNRHLGLLEFYPFHSRHKLIHLYALRFFLL